LTANRLVAALATLAVLLGVLAPARAGVDRPPQFVVMAFDNCTELERWRELTDFAAELNKDGDRIHFTFFVSGINFIADSRRSIYEGPHQRRGYSRISFGGSTEQVRKRIDYVNELYRSGPALYGALKANGFRYDTSGAAHADAWPEKIDGIWRFNLAMLRIQGLGRGALSMDYNFFMAQSRALDDPRRYEAARQQTLQTYLHYFKANYAGNRAPLHIGHHFMNYQGGAYNEALKSFARAVCGLPEVRCVTYARLADFLDRQNAETLAAYRKGDFARAATPVLNVAENRR